MASAQRHRPKPWVQAKRKVPVSSSLASTGAPTNAPISAGTTCSRMAGIDMLSHVPLNVVARSWQAGEPAGWQAVAAAQAWCTDMPAIHSHTASAPSSKATPASAIRCWRQVIPAIRRHGTGRSLASSSSGRAGMVSAVIAPPPTWSRASGGAAVD